MSNNKLICKICLNSGKVQKGKVVLKIYKLEISWLENINCCFCNTESAELPKEILHQDRLQ